MRPRAEVTVHMTKKQYELMRNVVEAARWGRQHLGAGTCSQVLNAAEFNPLFDERVTVGSSYRRGTG